MRKLASILATTAVACTVLFTAHTATASSPAKEATPSQATANPGGSGPSKLPTVYPIQGQQEFGVSAGGTVKTFFFTGCANTNSPQLPVNPNGGVAASATEQVNQADHIGDARITVHNVSVVGSTVIARVCVEHPTSLLIRVRYIFS